MIHLEQVHDEIKIPEEIRPTKLWKCIANNNEWMWKFVTKYLLTKNEEHANCNICDKRLSITVDYATINSHIYNKHKTDYGKRIPLQVLQEKNFFSIENNQAKCNKCSHISSIRCIDQNKDLENHFSNEHKLDYAQINDFVNWLKLYQNVIYFQTLECNACKNISNDNYFSLMKHFIKEHPIKFLLHLISKKLLDNLQILKIFNDAKDIAKPGGSNQQPRQNINQSSFKITSPRLSDISEFKSSDNDIENVGTSAISSYDQPTPYIDQSSSNNTSKRLINDKDLDISNADDDAEDNATSSCQQPVQNVDQNLSKISLTSSARQIIQSRYIMDTSSLEDSNWFLNFCTIENNMAMCDICSWKHNLLDDQLKLIESHLILKHKESYWTIINLSRINFRSYESTQVYAIKNNDVYCNFCEQIYFGGNETFRYIQKHITDIHIDGINKAKEICNWLQKHFGKNIVDAKSCCCNHCNNDIPNKPAFLMIHLEQVHDEIKIPEEIRPTKLWESTANRKEWMWKFVTKYLLTKGENVQIAIFVVNVYLLP
ncbi:uncharacterized protein LOC114932943 [Nylanderia fulva]|uniref:uncharacterized protein LOC114932943 n=1 Tax=Nylanderia fulva TaxID=613905 RepID=UPI0010FB79F6|nr:uncharacterized protein LOC114932943 [Nylanderia fulva]